MGIFESHAHYDDRVFDADRDELLGRLLPEAGVEFVVNVGADPRDLGKAAGIAEKYGYVYLSVGAHPHYVEKMTEADLAFCTKFLKNPKVVAVGEIGLDYHYEGYDEKAQKYWFSRQLELAGEAGLPVIIHAREADEDVYEIIRGVVEKDKPFLRERKERRGVLHCFSQSADMAEKYADMGFFIGVGGVVTYKKADTLVDVVRKIPLEKILLETDCPYLAPVPFRGSRNNSQNLSIIAEKIGEIKQISREIVIDVTTKNALSLFDVKK